MKLAGFAVELKQKHACASSERRRRRAQPSKRGVVFDKSSSTLGGGGTNASHTRAEPSACFAMSPCGGLKLE